MAINDLVAVVAQVRCFHSGKELSSGTSFFYTQKEELLLITNRHVIIDESKDYRPDEIRLLLHTTPNDIRQNSEFSLPLYTDESHPIWREHPVGGSEVDVVAIPIDRKELERRFFLY